jgi:hypothetical protein
LSGSETPDRRPHPLYPGETAAPHRTKRTRIPVRVLTWPLSLMKTVLERPSSKSPLSPLEESFASRIRREFWAWTLLPNVVLSTGGGPRTLNADLQSGLELDMHVGRSSGPSQGDCPPQPKGTWWKGMKRHVEFAKSEFSSPGSFRTSLFRRTKIKFQRPSIPDVQEILLQYDRTKDVREAIKRPSQRHSV